MELQIQIYILIGVFGTVLVFLINAVISQVFKLRKLRKRFDEHFARFNPVQPAYAVSGPQYGDQQVLPRVVRPAKPNKYFSNPLPDGHPYHQDLRSISPSLIGDMPTDPTTDGHRRSYMNQKGYPLPTKSVMDKRKMRSSFNDNSFSDQHYGPNRGGNNGQNRGGY